MQQENYDITYEDLNPAFLFSCSLKRTEDETNYHCHDFIELAIILKGKSLFYIDGREYEAKEGDLVILNPGTYHKSLLSREPGEIAQECYIAFSGVHFQNTEKEHMPLYQGTQIIYPMPAKLCQDIFRICAAISKEYETCKTGRYFMLKAYLIQLLCLIQRSRSEEGQTGERGGYYFKSVNKRYVVEQIKKYLDQHYQEKISLDQIARNMYLSPFYISKIFKTETGDTPINYLIELRMERAREILESGQAGSIQNVAAQVGYEDAYHFSKLFKKHFGIAPSRWTGSQ